MRRECELWATRYNDRATRNRVVKDMADHFLVMAFLPFQAAEIRQKIKYWGGVKGIMTQCIVSVPIHSKSWRTTLCPVITASKSEGSEEQVQ